MDTITEWVKNIFIVILSITFMEILMPEGSMARYLKFIFSVVILAVILTPLSYFLHK